MWPRGLGGLRAQPGQVQFCSGSSYGYLHTPGSRVCSFRLRAIRPLQPGHFIQGWEGSSAIGSSEGPVPTSGKADLERCILTTCSIPVINRSANFHGHTCCCCKCLQWPQFESWGCLPSHLMLRNSFRRTSEFVMAAVGFLLGRPLGPLWPNMH